MATVDVSRVAALSSKAVTLSTRGHFARAAEKYAEAVTAAQALHQPDCVVVAHLQAVRAGALVGHAHTAGVPYARRVELMRSAFLELLPAAMASLERRRTAGTLVPGACRPYEVAWLAAELAHGEALGANMALKLTSAATGVLSAAEVADTVTANVGHDAYILTAQLALAFCEVCTDVSAARRLNLPEATAVACSVFVESAFDMITQLRMTSSTPPEAALVRNAQIIIDEQRFRTVPSREWHAHILAAWRSLQSSGVLQRRGILRGMSLVEADEAHQTAAAAATAAARGLHFCALRACGAQEVHASQFKRCSACLSVVYCCKEHQVQDWPAHKAACRAARKAAEQDADEASGA
jgi:hypothetical protein